MRAAFEELLHITQDGGLAAQVGWTLIGQAFVGAASLVSPPKKT